MNRRKSGTLVPDGEHLTRSSTGALAMSESPVPGPTPKLKLRWYQYRLRTFLLFGLAVSLGLSWYAVRRGPVQTEEEAIARLRAAGGGVDGGDPVSTYMKRVWFGSWTSVTDADLRHLQALKHLETFSIVYPTYHPGTHFDSKADTAPQRLCLVTDAGLQHLEGVKSLRRLHLGGVPITDAGLQHLEGLKSLEVLHLTSTQIFDYAWRRDWDRLEELTDLEFSRFGGNQITDAGLRYLAGLKSLQELAIGGDQITDGGLQHLVGLNRLETLALWGNGLTGAGLKHLERLPLRGLSLTNTQVTDAELDRFPQLERLRVENSPFTDAALKRLEGLTHLRRLEILHTSVTDAGLKDLKLPSLEWLKLDERLSGTDGVLAFRNAHPECRVWYHE